MQEFKQISPRYQPDQLQPDERQAEAQASVRAAMVKLFGDGKTHSDGDFTVGGASYITHNGLPTKSTRMSDTPGGRRMLEKARRDIAEHKRHIEWQETIQAAQREWPSDDILWLKQFIKDQSL